MFWFVISVSNLSVLKYSGRKIKRNKPKVTLKSLIKFIFRKSAVEKKGECKEKRKTGKM